MEFDLKEISITLVLGAYALFGIELLAYVFFGSTLLRRLQKHGSLTEGRALSLIVTGCFAVGMLIEDLSNKFVDTDTPHLTRALAAVNLRTDDQIKWQTLYGPDPSLKVRPLGAEIACRGLLTHFLGTGADRIERQIVEHRRISPSDKDLWASVARQFYYTAKNRVYREDTYYDELKHIQMRIDFSRSFFAVSLGLLVALFLLLIPKLLFPSLGRMPGKWLSPAGRRWIAGMLTKWRSGQEDRAHSRRMPYKRKRLFYLHCRDRLCVLGRFVIAVLLLCTSAFLGALAYTKEEEQFDLRAYGYFLSLQTDAAAIRPNCKVLGT